MRPKHLLGAGTGASKYPQDDCPRYRCRPQKRVLYIDGLTMTRKASVLRRQPRASVTIATFFRSLAGPKGLLIFQIIRLQNAARAMRLSQMQTSLAGHHIFRTPIYNRRCGRGQRDVERLPQSSRKVRCKNTNLPRYSQTSFVLHACLRCRDCTSRPC